MSDQFGGSPWRFLRDFIENEIDQRKAAGFADDHDYVAMAQRAHDALLALWADSDKAVARIEAAERLIVMLKALCIDLTKITNAGNPIQPRTWMVEFSLLKPRVDECDVAAGRRTLTPRQHAS